MEHHDDATRLFYERKPWLKILSKFKKYLERLMAVCRHPPTGYLATLEL